MNVKLDHRGYIPVFVSVTTANKHEVSSVKIMEFQKGDVITFDWAPTTIATIYKDRWQIEIFFKTIKQNLKIKKFFGTIKNAVMTQILIALIAHLMLQYLKMLSSGGWTHYSLMKLLPLILTTKKNLWSVLNKLELL
ncbi:MAG TPA: hypothetical protein DCO79_00110 [Spirochaeta sp.]|nr:hypothetical protein [Spirochaeta sp.]